MSNPIINFVLRGTQALFGIVVLALSVDLIRNHQEGDIPASLGFAAFVGGISLLAAFVGIAATWFEFLQGIIGVGIDAVITLLNIAGGVLIAIKLKGADCSDKKSASNYEKMMKIDLLNAGCNWFAETWSNKCVKYFDGGKDYGKLNARCKQSQADSVFMFLLVVVLIVSATLAFLKRR